MTDNHVNPDHPNTPKPREPLTAKPVGPAAESHAILQSMLTPDEKIIRHATISPGIYWKGIALLGLALLVLIKAFNLGVFLLLVTAIILVIAHLTKHFLLLAATNKRIIMRGGIMNLDVIQLRYSKVESVEVAWTIMGQFLGYASVVITGTGSRVVVIPYVADAAQFRETINQQLMAREDLPGQDQ